MMTIKDVFGFDETVTIAIGYGSDVDGTWECCSGSIRSIEITSRKNTVVVFYNVMTKSFGELKRVEDCHVFSSEIKFKEWKDKTMNKKYWDNFLQELRCGTVMLKDEKLVLPHCSPAELLEAFYYWLVENGALAQTGKDKLEKRISSLHADVNLLKFLAKNHE